MKAYVWEWYALTDDGRGDSESYEAQRIKLSSDFRYLQVTSSSYAELVEMEDAEELSVDSLQSKFNNLLRMNMGDDDSWLDAGIKGDATRIAKNIFGAKIISDKESRNYGNEFSNVWSGMTKVNLFTGNREEDDIEDYE